MVDHPATAAEQAAPGRYGPPTTCYNRFVGWAKLGVWDRIFAAVSKAYGDLQAIDASSIRVHQHGGNVIPTHNRDSSVSARAQKGISSLNQGIPLTKSAGSEA